MASTSKEVEQVAPTNAPAVFADNMLAAIKSFDDVAAMFNDNGIAVETITDYGTGFSVVDKARLVGVPMLLIEWRFNDGDFGEFVSVAAITKANEKVIFNDGSAKSGILSQLRLVTQQRIERGSDTPQTGLLVEGGLTRSDYTYEDEKGQQRPATTFYLAE